jgi:hypothetical protein
VPLRAFMSARTMVRLVGVRGFTRLVLGQHQRGNLASNVLEPTP